MSGATRRLLASPWIRVLRLEYQGDNFLTWFSATTLATSRGAPFDRPSFLLGLATLVLAQAALELLDGYHDFAQGAHGTKLPGDQVWTGGSGVLAAGALAPRAVHRAAWCTGLAACALFAVLTVVRTRTAGLVIGSVGAVCGAGWAMPPFKLSYRGLGEAAQAIVAGPLMAGMAWVIAAGRFDGRALALGVPFGLFELCMALAHNLIDAEADARAGKRTLVVRIGRRRASVAYGIVLAAAFASVAALVLLDVLPPFALACLVLVPAGVSSARLVRRAAVEPEALAELSRTFPPYRLHMLFGLLLVGVLFAAGLDAAPSSTVFLMITWAVCYGPVALLLLARRAS